MIFLEKERANDDCFYGPKTRVVGGVRGRAIGQLVQLSLGHMVRREAPGSRLQWNGSKQRLVECIIERFDLFCTQAFTEGKLLQTGGGNPRNVLGSSEVGP